MRMPWDARLALLVHWQGMASDSTAALKWSLPWLTFTTGEGHIVRATTLAMDSSVDGGGDGILEGASPRASVDGEAIDSEDEEGALAGSSPPHSTASHFACSARAIAGKQVQRP